MPSRRTSSYQTTPPGTSAPPLPPTPLHHRSMSTASSVTRAVHSPEPPPLAKEKEFMANARILALSNLIDSITVPQAKQGYYGKQLKVIGSTLSPTASSGAELDITVKVDFSPDPSSHSLYAQLTLKTLSLRSTLSRTPGQHALCWHHQRSSTDGKWIISVPPPVLISSALRPNLCLI